MKLSEALDAMKDALVYEDGDSDPSGCKCVCCCAERLVAAVEEHLEAERKSAETLLCLADLQRHGGE